MVGILSGLIEFNAINLLHVFVYWHVFQVNKVWLTSGLKTVVPSQSNTFPFCRIFVHFPGGKILDFKYNLKILSFPAAPLHTLTVHLFLLNFVIQAVYLEFHLPLGARNLSFLPFFLRYLISPPSTTTDSPITWNFVCTTK